ncbi:hypothetical protein SPBRAN_1135 [uncultured Candidatus Thioglobus sp.]|nr:hypothetical protein SPBRAN_1135 [uncultured Candidatus Thioglobus sp.]
MQGFKCGATFASYRTHANRHHPDWQVLNTSDISVHTSYEASSCVLPSELELDADQSQCTTDQLDTPFATVEPEQDPQRVAAMLLLTLKEKYMISQDAVNFTLGSISSIVDGVCDSIKDSIQERSSLTSDMLACFNHSDPFDSLQTEYQQTKFYKKEFGLVVRGLII